jgi:tetratricopeptide (TPR) repeat protein
VTLAAAQKLSSSITKLEDLLAKTASAYEAMMVRGAPAPMLKLARHSLVQVHLQMGEHHLATGQLQAAAESGHLASLFAPDDRDVAMLTVRALLAANDIGRALPVLERAAEVHAADATIQALLAQVYLNSGRADDAVEPFERAIALQPGDVKLMAAYANALAVAGDIATALSAYRKVLALVPDDIALLSRYGLLCNDAGAFDEARATFARLIALQPGRGLYHRLFGKLHAYGPDDPHIRQMEALLARAEPNGDDRRELGFALFHALESVQQFDRAFAHLKAANDIRRGQLNYRPVVFQRLFDNVEAAFANLPAGAIARSPRDESPIFIIGMPRSGSTLVEQILDSHPDASAAGETPAFAALVEKQFLKPDLSYDLSLLGNARSLDALGEAYFAAIGGSADVTRRTVDKYLTNFMSVGIIKAVFPRARIVHCRRNPLANCFSAYANHFDGNGLAFKTDMAETARYYVRYDRLMRFWSSLYGDDILDMSYERLTEDQEGQTRRLLAYCGLAWHPDCMDFHQNRRVVRTASYMQVRQPLYSGTDRRTGQYLAHLGPMIDILAEAGLHPRQTIG